MAVAISGPLVAEAANAGLKVSQIAELMLIVLVLGAGTDYGLFLVFRVREQLRAGADPREAVRSRAAPFIAGASPGLLGCESVLDLRIRGNGRFRCPGRLPPPGNH